jgi:flagellar biosynthesis protein FliP
MVSAIIKIILFAYQSGMVWAVEKSGALPPVQLSVGGASSPEQTATALKLVALLTVLGLAPSLLIMMTTIIVVYVLCAATMISSY